MTDIKIPDIGDFDEVEVIEVLVSEGDTVEAEDPLLTLESDKATMDIPSPSAGTIKELKVSVGDMVSEGTLAATLTEGGEEDSGDEDGAEEETKEGDSDDDKGDSDDDRDKSDEVGEEDDDGPDAEDSESKDDRARKKDSGQKSKDKDSKEQTSADSDKTSSEESGDHRLLPHASPAIRRYARELGANLKQIKGSGPKGRIVKEDVNAWVKGKLAEKGSKTTGEPGIPPIPEIDFSEFGEVDTQRLGRIKKLSGPHLQRSWLNVPHVTQHDEADITELEEFRQSLKKEAEAEGLRVTILSFAMKVLVRALKKFPNFNASLSPDGDALIMKKYFNIGIAVDTPNGLVVPVVRDVDRKSIFDLARDLADVSERARDGKLKPDDLKGGCISISSLGGIGGTAFTPIVNAPEVAILGLSRAKMAPVWDGKEFQPRLILPLSLSYDHRVVDGAEAARFCAQLAQSFGDVRRLSL